MPFFMPKINSRNTRNTDEVKLVSQNEPLFIFLVRVSIKFSHILENINNFRFIREIKMNKTILNTALAFVLSGLALSANAKNIINLTFDGTNGSNAFGTGVSVIGNAQITTSQSYSGSGSLFLDGFSSLTLNGDNLNIGTSDFEISFEFKTNGPQNPYSYILFGEQLGTPVIGNGTAQYNSSLYLWPSSGSDPTETAIISNNYNDNQWHKLSIIKQQSVESLYVDNILQGSAVLAPNTITNLNGLVIGHVSIASGYNLNWDNSFIGYIDNFSISAAVPEPETYAMMLVGIGMIGFMARRRKNTQA